MLARRPLALLFCVAMCFVSAGILGNQLLTSYLDHDPRNKLLSVVREAVSGLSIDDVKQLTGDPADAGTPVYARVNESLNRIYLKHNEARFVYLLGLRENQVVFLADRESAQSPSFSAPGDAYAEASPQLRRSLTESMEFIEGPFADRWGEWVSAHASLVDPRTDAVVAVVGLDVSAHAWNRSLASHQLVGFGIAAFLAAEAFAIGLICIYVYRTNLLLGKQMLEREHVAQELRRSAEEKDLAYKQLSASKCELEGANQQLKAQQVELREAYQHLKEHEHHLRIHEAKYRQLVENANSVILQMSPEGTITFFNEYAQRFFGYSADEILGKNVVGTIVPEVDSSGRDLRAMILDIGKQPEKHEIQVLENIRRNGDRVYLVWSNQSILDERGRVHGVLCVGNDITLQKQTEDERRDELARIQRQQSALVELATCDAIRGGDLDSAMRVITETACRTLHIEQAGVWLMSENGECLRCVDQFRTSPNAHTQGEEFHVNAFPEYFAALQDARVIDAHSASGDPRTREFDEEYLRPRGITSMLDATIRLSGTLIGVVCLEHVGPARKWSAGESAFAGAIADQVVQAIMSEDRNRRERELRESEQRYRTLFESANDAILLMDGESFLDGNPKSLEMFGCTGEQLAGMDHSSFSPELQPDGGDSSAEFQKGIRAALNGAPQSFEWQYLRADGSTFDAEVSLNQLNLSGRDLLLATVRDIAQRKRTEEERLLLTMAIEQAAEVVFVTDTSGRLQYVNPAFERTAGYTRSEVIGQNPRILKSGRQDRSFYQNMWNTLTRGDIWSGRLVNRRKDGTLWHEEATISPVRDAQGKTTHYVAVMRDVTREAELETRLRQAQKMESIGTLAGGIAHDFNNILQALMGYTDLLAEHVEEGGEAKDYLAQLRDAEKRAKDLVGQILAFSRQSEQECKPMKLQPILKEALKLLRGALPSTIEIRSSVSGECGPVLADPTQIHQVLMNLATNAYHAMRETGGMLDVSLGTQVVDDQLTREKTGLVPGYYAKLTVRDTGAGMDRGTLERIFDPYFTTKEKGEGTGLGLATVHGIIKSHQGTVFAQSEPGKGSTFTVLLPLAMQADAAEGDQNAAQTPVRGRECILFVDDETQIVQSGKAALEILGYQVTTYTRSLDALRDFKQNPKSFDLVITDQTMPKLTGIDLAREMLQIRPGIPIILYTGHSEIVDEQCARAAGIHSFLMKPIAYGELAAAVRQVLTRRPRT
ncbi:MAG: PAS domain S-box protein [Candidatus Hydrogenedentes bacterium]|nr:PAS domain S-box protein [Candidatus Hydrogenedentota bacterium]